jgi:hypothetical protein
MSNPEVFDHTSNRLNVANADGINSGQQLLGYAVDQDKGAFASGKLRISRLRGR